MPVEIEIKSLLGERAAADALRTALLARGAVLGETSVQLNHYFVGEALPTLAARAQTVLSRVNAAALSDMVGRARKASVRTRLLNQTVLLIVKAALDDTSSANGITRLEFEAEAHDVTLDALDTLVIDAGYQIQAKWSRRREAYRLGDVVISIDQNAGYGFLAEFEVLAHDDSQAQVQAARLRGLMAELGLIELAQDRLERMFAHYNAHWQDYYGTDKTFTVA
jgi:adenylate cyclase class IV